MTSAQLVAVSRPTQPRVVLVLAVLTLLIGVILSSLGYRARARYGALIEELQSSSSHPASLRVQDYTAAYREGPVALGGVVPDRGGLQVLLDAGEDCRVTRGAEVLPLVRGRCHVPLDLGDAPVQVDLTVHCAGRDYSLRLEVVPAPGAPARVVVVSDLPRSRGGGAPSPVDQLEAIQAAFAVTASAAASERVDEVLSRLADRIAGAAMDKRQRCVDRSGWAMLLEVEAGKSFIDCSGKSRVGRDVLVALGIPARRIYLESQEVPLGDYVVSQSESHWTTEAKVEGAWRWFDLTFNCLYARDVSSQRRLTLWELMVRLTDSAPRALLRFGVYDPKRRRVSERALAEDAALRANMVRYLSPDKTLRFGR